MKKLFLGLLTLAIGLSNALGQDFRRPVFAQKGGTFRNHISTVPAAQGTMHLAPEGNVLRLVSGGQVVQLQGTYHAKATSNTPPPVLVVPTCLGISSIDAQSGEHLYRLNLTNQKVGARDYNLRFKTTSGILISQRDVLNINAVNVPYLLFKQTNEGILGNGSYRVEVRDKSDTTCVATLTYATSQFQAAPPTTADTTIITMGGVQHKNVNLTVDMGQYNLVYKTMPGSLKFKYTPRVELKAMTTTPDLQLTKFGSFSLTALDVAMYDSKVDDFTTLLTKGITHVNSRHVFNQNGGNGALSNPNRPHKDIPWTKRFHMTMPNNFDWIPAFQSGQNLSSAQIESLKGWVTGDGVSNYFTDNQAPEWHLLDWEFQYNDGTWTQLANHYKQTYSNKYLHSWMGNFQMSGGNLTNYPRLTTYDAWPQTGYYHLTDWVNSGNVNCSDGIAQHLDAWKQLWHQDYWGILQSLNRSERFKQLYPNAWAISGYMTAYEDGAGGGQLNHDYYKLHPSLAENGPLWALLGSRSVPGKKGGVVIWNAHHPNEPLTSEQYAIAGFHRLSFHNTVRSSASYQWVKPQISYDGGATWKEQTEIIGFGQLSSLSHRQEREGQTVKEPVVRCLVTTTHVTLYAQNPYDDAPAAQTIKIRIPGVIEDYVTIYRVNRTVSGVTFNDRQMTMAVATRN